MSVNNEIREESIKLKVAYRFFENFDCTNIEGDIDFTVTDANIQTGLFTQGERNYYVWAEAKRPHQKDIYKLFAQLILTIGKSEKLRNLIPPKFLAAFNSEKIGFIEYASIHDIFSINDFNWNVAPSNYDTKEFKQLYELVRIILTKDKQPNVFLYDKDEEELKKFIKNNFKKTKSKGFIPIEITKNNFVHVYRRWLDNVKNTIDIDWKIAEKNNILDVDFFFADLFSDGNNTIKSELNALLKGTYYECDRQKNIGLGINAKIIRFKDNQIAHTNFWLKYKRPPKNAYQDYILKRKDLLVPQDIREIKGAYFTPQIWVQKSQEYLADVLGENWQDEYYIWDCCAGTGNMENGLTNKYNVWASTLDQSDVDIMKDRINNGANLLESHIFQFDFLNDKFEDKCPQDLLEILKDEKRRKKLIIYINPPYKEATSLKTIVSSTDKHKSGVSDSLLYDKYHNLLGRGVNEIYAQFFMRIYKELYGCTLGEFSTLKILQSQNFDNFRTNFKAKLKKMFIVPADTFDNVSGKFPIGFMIWNTKEIETFTKAVADVYDYNGTLLGVKNINSVEKDKVILNWMQQYYDKTNPRIAYMVRGASDFQNNNIVFFTMNPSKAVIKHSQTHDITEKNLIENSIFYTVRKVIKPSWINNRDQFLYPNDYWKMDLDFQTNCLVFMLFGSQNIIKSSDGINHWIPFTEQEVDAKNNFTSHFMTDFIKEKGIEFSDTAKEVLASGKELYKYYHSKSDSNPNASFYDIRMYFQGLNDKGKMNSNSIDETYSMLLWNLRQKLKKLEKEIIPKIYEYGFLGN